MKKIIFALLLFSLILNAFAVDRIIDPNPPIDEILRQANEDYPFFILAVVVAILLSTGAAIGVFILLFLALKAFT